MLLLGINCGYGNSDVGTLPLDKIDLENGWATYHRPKTGVKRRCPLWPETIAALRASLANRPKPKMEDAAKLFFVTKYGASWAKSGEDNPITKEVVKLLKEQNLHRPGYGFYVLRHTHRSIADGALDQPAANYIIGHADESMAANYRHGFDCGLYDDRLAAVAEHVRKWLLKGKPKRKGEKSALATCRLHAGYLPGLLILPASTEIASLVTSA
jgi:integrase